MFHRFASTAIVPLSLGGVFAIFKRHTKDSSTARPTPSSEARSPTINSSDNNNNNADVDDDETISKHFISKHFDISKSTRSQQRQSQPLEPIESSNQHAATATTATSSSSLTATAQLRIQFEQQNAVHGFRLALKGSAVCAQWAPILLISHREPRTPLQLEDAIKKLQLDEEWTKLIRWSVTHVCDENDLACGEEMIGRRSGQEAKLNRLLTILIAKSENGFGEELIEQGILSILFDVCTNFAASNRDLFINAMKLLANIVVQSEKCSIAVAESEWLQRLAAMISVNSLEENLLAEKVCLNAISVLTKSDVRFETDVYQLYQSEDVNEEPVVDLIFVHGLRGGVFRTWRAKDDPNDRRRTQCWPRSWLPYDLHKPIRILALDYPSSIWNIRGGSVETLSKRSSRFRKQLKAAGVGRRPIVFVGHSLGGLLVKRLIVDDEELLRQTIGVMFIATPHRGSPFARYALRFAIRPTDDVVLLSLQNETNKKLHEDFLRICPSIAVICSMAETEDSPLILRQRGILVPSESAFFERGPLYHIRDIHYNVCKPSGPNDKAYGVILQFLHDVVFHLSKK